MTTTKERILVTLTPTLARGIRSLARRERLPRATVAARMLHAAWSEIEEDVLTRSEEKALAKIVRERDIPGAKYLTPEEADALFCKLHNE